MKPSVQMSVRSLRYIPIGGFAIMFFHVIMLMFGIDCPICEIILIISGFFIAYTFSRALGFCRIHRMCIYYALAIMACIWMRRYPEGEYGLFGDKYIDEARLVAFIIGCVIASILLMKEIRDHRKCSKHDHSAKQSKPH